MLNNVCIVGRLVADCDLKYTPQGVAVASFRVACTRNYKNSEGAYESDFFNVTVWRQQAEFLANNGAKGRLLSISGELQQRSWTTNEGQKRSVVEIKANSLNFLDKKGEEGGNGGGNGGSHPNEEEAGDEYS